MGNDCGGKISAGRLCVRRRRRSLAAPRTPRRHPRSERPRLLRAHAHERVRARRRQEPRDHPQRARPAHARAGAGARQDKNRALAGRRGLGGRDIRRRPVPPARSDRMAATFLASVSSRRLRPGTLPSLRARARPASTRSRIIARLNSANTPIIWNMARPEGVEVSTPCW